MDFVDSLLGGENLGVGLKFNYVCKNEKHIIYFFDKENKTHKFVTGIFARIFKKGKKKYS
jgi:hypothetical protein